ncbi:MAG: 50S ribosomal protein L15e [Methanotrichaceae archaeon]|jgi:large subunit ribosomal protein L15e|nr:50S ribosomal protein L15e [Methanotrichaceae archaeon]
MRSFYSYIGDAWDSPREGYVGVLRQSRLKSWRREKTVQKIARPTRLDRARALGYKAKQGIIIARVKVRRGGLRKSRYVRNRKTSKMGMLKITMGKSIRRIAEERASRRFSNMEVMNSYWVGEDGRHKWYEVILIDPHHPAIISDKDLGWITDGQRGRSERGKTRAGMKGRGMSKKGNGTEKTRPSIRAHNGKGK